MLYGDLMEVVPNPLLRATSSHLYIRLHETPCQIVRRSVGRGYRENRSYPALDETSHERSRHLRFARARWALHQCQPGINGLQHGVPLGRIAPKTPAD